MGDQKISSDEVRRVARLARLALPDADVEKMRAQLDAILGYVVQLDVLDVGAVEPTFHAVPVVSPLRADEVKASLSRAEVLAAAPASDAGGFAVPKVMDGE